MLIKNINKDIRESFNLINKYRILFTAFCLSIPVYLINFTTNANSFMFAGYSLYFLALIANVKQIRFDQAFGKLVLFLCFFLFFGCSRAFILSSSRVGLNQRRLTSGVWLRAGFFSQALSLPFTPTVQETSRMI